MFPKPVATNSRFGSTGGSPGCSKARMLVIRFPVDLCTDKGRAINNNEPDWPESLTGRPRQAYELWRDRLRGDGFKLTAMIVEWPAGLPRDVGFFLGWSEGRPA
jgi:hypothetical protein